MRPAAIDAAKVVKNAHPTMVLTHFFKKAVLHTPKNGHTAHYTHYLLLPSNKKPFQRLLNAN
jgi:hypothetical protein